ncbi:MAG: YqaE/Pmp3 family membrane protein [Bacteroidia bacterium]
MKNIFSLLVVAIAAFAFTSCSTDLRVEKRRYNDGWYVHHSSKKQSTNVAKENTVTATENAVVAQEETTTSTSAEPTLSPANTTQETPAVAAQTTKSEKTSLAKTAKKPEVKKVAEKKNSPIKNTVAKIKKATKENAPATSDDKFILAIILAIFFPCIGVLIWEGDITTNFWVALLLMFLFWLPGIIFAILVITGNLSLA